MASGLHSVPTRSGGPRPAASGRCAWPSRRPGIWGSITSRSTTAPIASWIDRACCPAMTASGAARSQGSSSSHYAKPSRAEIQMQRDPFTFAFSACSTRIPCCACFSMRERCRAAAVAVLGLALKPAARSRRIFKRLIEQSNRKPERGAGCRPVVVRAAAWLYRWVRNTHPTPPSKLSSRARRPRPGSASKMGRFSRRGVRGESRPMTHGGWA